MANLRFRFAAAKERPVESRQESKEYGDLGEQIASRYLEDQGYVILGRNYRNGHKEVDIIAQKDGTLYFVEVKTRHGEEWNAEEAITSKKRTLLWRAQIAWKLQHPSPMPVRYPVIAIVIHGPETPPEIRWHDDIWNL